MVIQWLRRAWQQRRTRGRALFSYHDGARLRRADPAELWRKLLNHTRMNFADMLPLAHQGQEPEATIVLEALAEIFRVERWDDQSGRGLTNWELLDLVREFDEYLTELKKTLNPSLMPWQLLVYGSSTGPEPQSETTSFTAASCSTPPASNSAAATASSAPSPTPSLT